MFEGLKGLIELAGLVVGVAQALMGLTVPGKAAGGGLVIGDGSLVILEDAVGFAAEEVDVMDRGAATVFESLIRSVRAQVFRSTKTTSSVFATILIGSFMS